MVFVVFKCTKCGKVTYNECRKKEKVSTKSYKCYRCGGSSSYKKMKLYRVEDNVRDAQLKAIKAGLNEITALNLKEKEQYLELWHCWREKR